jgi:hypothetical protein
LSAAIDGISVAVFGIQTLTVILRWRRAASVPALCRLCNGRCGGTERPAFSACHEFRLEIAVDPNVRATAERAWP